jgi:hypothetical protein
MPATIAWAQGAVGTSGPPALGGGELNHGFGGFGHSVSRSLVSLAIPNAIATINRRLVAAIARRPPRCPLRA